MDQRAPKTTWSTQEAKNQLSRMLAAAHAGPQFITKHGREAGVLLSPESYRQLKDMAESKKPTLSELLLAIPKGGPDEDIFPRMNFKLRDVEF